MTDFPLLSLIIFTPWLGAAVLAALRHAPSNTARALGMAFSVGTLALTLVALTTFEPARTTPQFVERYAWIAALNVHYHLALDGLSLVLLLLTAIVTPAAMLASWSLSTQNPKSQTPNSAAPPSARLYYSLFLALEGAALGVFLARDFFHWFLFWELSLVPAFFLIKLWGGPASTRAAYQFVIYTIGGSAFMLLGFAALYAATGTLDFGELARQAADGSLQQKLSALSVVGSAAPSPRAFDATMWIFLCVLLGLAVKVPLWPFHTWLPPAYAEAPTGASMFLTGVMSKMGLYGFIRILWPIFPAQLHAASGILIWLALGGIVLGAFAALRQTDLKRMVAYSSLNHLSYCLLALFAVSHATGGGKPAAEAASAALSGTILQIFNHGLSAAALFYCIGILETRAAGRRGLLDFGGVRTAAPIFAGLCGVALFSSLGLPGLNGFVGEFLIFRGVFGLAPWAAAVATLGLLATALFLLTFWQRVFHGPAGATVRSPNSHAAPAFSDLRGIEYGPLVPLVALMFILGLAPQLLAGLINPLVTSWAGHLTLP
jgi:NADH-quinone oxidoreductase subunit M